MSVTGRFAPSPTGPLHFGSVVAAVASYMQVRAQQGIWLVRIDDVDTPRNVPGADTTILKTLDAFGLHWDGGVLFQSHRNDAYQEALSLLTKKELLYRCICTRKQLKGMAYPGTCRLEKHDASKQHALRLTTNQTPVVLHDEIQGEIKQNLGDEIGDFIVHRADGLVAYHIATVVDDAYQGITEIVRGADLLDSTPRQIYLQQLLNYSSPAYAHIPVAVDKHGNKLSKQHHACPVNDNEAVTTLFLALDFLGQQPPETLLKGNVDDIIQWGIQHWTAKKIPKKATIEVSTVPD